MNERSRNDQLVVPPERDEMFPALAPGIDPEDIPPLWLLQSKLPVLEAFMTLFRGSMTDSLVRLLVLGEMGRRGQAPEWTFAELRQTFAYLTPAPLESALRRLRVGGLLRYDATESAYVLTPAGLRVYGAVAALFQLTEEDDLGWITGVVRASYELGTLTPEVLSHLLYRLRRLETELQQAVEALSEPRILQARERLTSIWSWIERGSAMIAQIVQDSALDRELHRVAQQIGRAQSRLLRMTTVFQRVLNDIDRQRVHLGATGLSTSDLVFFLRQCTLDDLERLIAPHLARPVRPLFLLTDLITDQAEYELLQRKRHVAEWCELPEAQDSPLSPPQRAAEFPELGRLVTQLQSETRPTVPLTEVVPWASFEESAYRLSMLSLLGDTEAAESGGLVARLASLPYTLAIEAEEAVVDRAGVARMNAGHLHQLSHVKSQDSPAVSEGSASQSSANPGSTDVSGNDRISIQPDIPSPSESGSARISAQTLSPLHPGEG
jgi:DNA-binding HxlR family transcriptional regulator/5'-deoxynucleotidase YfbR-like HD superfamily hydrolase